VLNPGHRTNNPGVTLAPLVTYFEWRSSIVPLLSRNRNTLSVEIIMHVTWNVIRKNENMNANAIGVD
jgi:hypothetical protein